MAAVRGVLDVAPTETTFVTPVKAIATALNHHLGLLNPPHVHDFFEVFANIFEVFVSFSSFRTRSDPFGCIRTSSVLFGYARMWSDALGPRPA